jgi:hypothetical protein
VTPGLLAFLPDMPEGVTDIRGSGRRRGDELPDIKPALQDRRKTDAVRIVEVVDSD